MAKLEKKVQIDAVGEIRITDEGVPYIAIEQKDTQPIELDVVEFFSALAGYEVTIKATDSIGE